MNQKFSIYLLPLNKANIQIYDLKSYQWWSTIFRCIAVMIFFGWDESTIDCETNSSFDDFRSLITWPLLATRVSAAGTIPLVRLSNRFNGKIFILRGDFGDLFVDLAPFTGNWLVPLCEPPRIAGSSSRFSRAVTTDESKAAGALDLCTRVCLGASEFNASCWTS